MVKSINYFWVLPTLSIRGKGKRFTSDYWIVSRFSVRWSSSSTIRTLMAWRSNIPQKSFLCERSFIPSEEWFVFYMQMTISTTRRRQLCILCCVYVLSKMLKLCGAEGSSFRWLIGTGSCFCGGPSNFVLKWISVLSSSLAVGGSPDRSFMMLLSGFDWCIQWLGSMRLLFLMWISFLKEHIGYCQTFVLKQHRCNS